MNLLKEPVKLSVQLARAIEIAIVGKHKISVYANLKSYPRAKQDFTSAKTSYSYLNIDRAIFVEENADIMIEIVKPEFSNLFQDFETISQIKDRIIKARGSKEPNTSLGDTSKQLLKTAYEKLNLGVSQVSSIIRVASTIAKMEDKAKIETQHIAEAIQYQCIDLEQVQIINK